MFNFINTRFYLIKSEGRFGNQLFQVLHVISDYPKNSVILAFNFIDTKKILSNKIGNIYYINPGNFLGRVVDKVFSLVIKHHIFSIIDQEKIITEAGKIHASNKKFVSGLFKNFVIIRGFYQSSKFLSRISRDTYKISKKDLTRSSIFIFVHFRRSDYKAINLMNESIVLNYSYYKKSIDFFKIIDPSAQFLIFSDEPLTDSDLGVFSGHNFEFSKASDPAQIYEEMLSCRGGIICNSSLSWLAAFHLKKIDKNALIVAPLNHIGHNIDIEIPEGINYRDFIYN